MDDLQARFDQLKLDNADTRECGDQLTACQDEGEEIRRKLQGCGEEVEKLTRDLQQSGHDLQGLQVEVDGDGINPGLKAQLHNAKKQFGALQGKHSETELQRSNAERLLRELKREVEDDHSYVGLRTQAGKYSKLQVEVEGSHHQEGLRAQNGRLKEQVKNLKVGGSDPNEAYKHGTLLAVGTYAGLYCFGGKRLEPIRKAVGKSAFSQASSYATATYSDESLWLNKRSSAEIKSLGNGFKAGVVNVTGETANLLLLQWSWNKWLADRVKTGNNIVAKAIRRTPEVLKDLTHLIVARACWNHEKGWFF